MRKITIIATIVAALLGIILLVTFLLPEEEIKPTPSNGSVNQFPIASSTTQTGQNTLTLKTAVGKSIVVKNFLSDTKTVADPVNQGHYYLGNHFPFDSTPPTTMPTYIIEYISPTQFFNIALIKEPIGKERMQAEQYLLSELGITKEDMCRLNYMVSVPVDVSEYYAGINLGFSFCPQSTPL